MFSIFFLLLSLCFYTYSDPNFVLVLTDDQDLILNGLLPMKKTLRLVANKGKVFENTFVNAPICCPNRATILTGKYVHNTGVVNNSLEGNCSNKLWQKYHEPFSIAAILKNKKKYTTFYAGKYLNQYGSKLSGGISHVPIGYDWWIGLKGNSKYYNYTLSINGTRVFYENDYLTDVLSDYAVDFLNSNIRKPFFMMVAPPAAHAPFIPAKRHQKAFPKAKALRNPSFNFTPVDKHWIVHMLPTHLPTNVAILDEIQRHRLQSLLAVDEMVERIYKKLVEMKLIKNTYIIFTSDNGFHIGQFTQPWDKRQPYETDIRVPLMISGPKIPRKTLDKHPISSVDLAPTILDLAGVKTPRFMDGRSFKRTLFARKSKAFENLIFIEYYGEGKGSTIDQGCPWKYDQNLAECSIDQWCKCQDSRNNTYSCVLAMSDLYKFKFCRFKDSQSFVEAYNLTVDPYELHNAFPRMKAVETEAYSRVLNDFEACFGSTCRLLSKLGRVS